MFGFITPNFNTLNEEEKSRYTSIYCGLCHSIRDNYNNISRLALTYDLTFLVMLLSSIYEPTEHNEPCNCIFHPGKKYTVSRNVYSDYCADLTVLLAYHKIKDDMHDDNTLRAKIGETALRSQYKKVKNKHPELCKFTEDQMAKIRKLEKVESPDNGDMIAKEFGLILSYMFSVNNDIFSENLAKFGGNLGRFIYFMDAAIDLEKDEQNYNPFKTIAPPSKEDLMILAGNATKYYELLPIVKDSHILDNILYEGMWITYNQKMDKLS